MAAAAVRQAQVIDDESIGSTTETDSLISSSHKENAHEIERGGVTWIQIIGGLIGNILEWYDFSIYAYCADILSDVFFPKDTVSKSVRMIAVYGIFASAFFARPLGGASFGWLGDRFGRKIAVALSLLIMFVSTFSIGLLPVYSVWGNASIILLLFFRIAQGFSCGGQLVGSMLVFLESAKEGEKGLYSSGVQVAGGIGVCLGSATMAIIYDTTGEKTIHDWAWRLPFLISSVLGVFGFIVQLKMPESADFLEEQNRQQAEESTDKSIIHIANPVAFGLKTYWRQVIFIALSIGIMGAGYYSAFIWVPEHLISLGHADNERVLDVTTITMVSGGFLILVGGYLSDKYGWWKVMTASATGSVIVLLPLFGWIEHDKSWLSMLFIQGLFGFFQAIYAGAVQLFMHEVIDDIRVRYSVMAVSYNVSLCLFGGTAPLVSEFLASQLSLTFVGLYLFMLALIALGLLVFVWRDYVFYEPLAMTEDEEDGEGVEDSIGKDKDRLDETGTGLANNHSFLVDDGGASFTNEKVVASSDDDDDEDEESNGHGSFNTYQ